jgi:flavin-dependent dehydrogenase
LEKQRTIGNYPQKIDITEDIDLQNILKEHNIKPEITSNTSFWHAGEHTFEFKSKIKELFFLRGDNEKSLEKQLFKQALNAGLETVFSAKTKIKNKKISLNNKEINSKIIVGTDGVDSIITKYCAPNEKFKIIEGYGQSYNDLDLPVGQTHVFFEQNQIPGGYVYISRTSTLGTIVLGCKNKPNEKYLDKIKKSDPQINEIIGKRKGTNIWGKGIISNINKRVYDNIILVGDAARVADPTFLYGVRQALISGDIAIKTIINHLENGEKLEQYDILLKNKLLQDYYLSKVARNTLEKTSQKDIEFIIRNLDEINNKIGLDGISQRPIDTLKITALLFAKNPYNITKISFKVIKSLFEAL